MSDPTPFNADAVYFTHRMSIASGATQLPALAQMQLALSPLSPAALQQAAEGFGAQAMGSGWGIGSFIGHLASTKPDTVRAGDLASIQGRLKTGGYLPPDYTADGTWSSETEAAFNRWETEKSNDFYSGHHPLATTTQRAIGALGWMLPAQIFQGVVGAAKGFVEQAPETVERVGALGGAVGGAAIGAAAGSIVPGVGTTIGGVAGAAIGGAAGFLGDLLSHAPEEGDQTFDQKLWDALTPYDEYKGQGGAQKFWEDLGFIGTAASLATGVGGGLKAAGVGIAGIEAGAEAGGTSFLAQSLAKGELEQPGIFGRLTAAATKHFSADAGTQVYDWYKSSSLLSQTTRPIIKDVLQPLITGAGTAQFGARMFAGLGSGDSETTIEKAIREAPLPRTGVELPFVGGIINLPGFVLQPTQFLPWKLSDLSRGVRAIVGSDTAFAPFANWYRRANPDATRDFANAAVRGILGRTPAEQVSSMTAMHLEHGVEGMAMTKVLAQNVDRSSPHFWDLLDGYKNDIREDIAGEIGGTDLVHAAGSELEGARAGAAPKSPKGSLLQTATPTAVPPTDMPTLREAMSYAYFDPQNGLKGPHAFEAYLTRLTRDGSGPEAMKGYFDATKITKDVTLKTRAGEISPLTTTGEVFGPGTVTEGNRGLLAELKLQETRLTKNIAKLSVDAAEKTADPASVMTILNEVRDKERALKDLRRQIKAVGTRGQATWEDKMIVATRQDTPTGPTYQRWISEYDQLAGTLEVATHNRNVAAADLARGMLDSWLTEHADHIPSKMLERALTATGKPGTEVGQHLQKLVSGAPQEVVLPDEYAAPLKALGYKATVIHARNSFEYAVDPRVLEATGINDITRRSNVWDSLGLGVDRVSDKGLTKLRDAHTTTLLDQLAAEKGWRLDGDQIMNRLHTGLGEINSTAVITNEEVRGLPPLGVKAPEVQVRHGYLTAAGPGGKRRFPALDVRDLKGDDIFEAMRDLPNFDHKDAQDVLSVLMHGSALASEMHVLHPLEAARSLGAALRVNGLQGFSDLARSWHAELPATEMKHLSFSTKRLAGATAAGAGIGYLEGDGDKKLEAALKGGTIGLATQLGIEQLLKRDYGFLPDHLYKVAQALRYSLSPSFDARRFVKGNLLAMTSHELPPMFGRADRYVKTRQWTSLYRDGGGTITGDEAWREAMRASSEAMGKGSAALEDIDSFERTLTAGGITGFSPLKRQAAHAYMLAQRGYDSKKIASALRDIYRYGTGRSPMEKSINYVFFPFSFEKKLLTSVGEFILQNPGRALLIHEGMRRYNQSKYAADVNDLLEKHLPILERLQEFNAFSHGISPGRFFLEGVAGNADETHRTWEGKAAQILANFFIPGGGAVTPIQEAVGAGADIAVNAFSPIVVTGESITKVGGKLGTPGGSIQQLTDLAGQYIPMVKDLNELWDHANDQLKAVAHGESPWSQARDYYDAINEDKRKLEPLATGLGYASVDGFLQSDIGASFADQLKRQKYELQNKYPDGFAMSTQFDNSAAIRDKALQDILHKPHPSHAEEAIQQIAATEYQWSLIGQTTGLESDLIQPILTGSVRSIALAHAGDARFSELWRDLFEPTYGPIRMVA